MNKIILITILMSAQYLSATGIFEEKIDSIAIIVNLELSENIKQNRQNFVREQTRLSLQNKLPVYVVRTPLELRSLIEILSTDSIESTKSVPTDTQLLKLLKTKRGDYDLKRGFVDVDDMNIKACVVVFAKDNTEIIWIGENNLDKDYNRYRKYGLFRLIKHFILSNFASTETSVFYSNKMVEYA